MKNPRGSVWCWSLAIGWTAILAAAASTQGAATPRPHAWQRWEHTLTSARQQENPYADVMLRVRYSGPDSHRLDGYGFWDGGQVVRIRCAFPITQHPGTPSKEPTPIWTMQYYDRPYQT